MKKIKMLAKNKGALDSEAWEEDLNFVEDEEPEITCKNIIKYFNSTLQRGETLREFIKVTGFSDTDEHNWEKDCLVTQVSKNSCYDSYKCTICGAKGKKFGLSSGVFSNKKKEIKCRKKA